jgi:hypothetical protein
LGVRYSAFPGPIFLQKRFSIIKFRTAGRRQPSEKEKSQWAHIFYYYFELLSKKQQHRTSQDVFSGINEAGRSRKHGAAHGVGRLCGCMRCVSNWKPHEVSARARALRV